ncbi:MAG TPA: hypothetical protein VI977_00065 [archaeon]|nr:hypothetical protein [archaeon]
MKKQGFVFSLEASLSLIFLVGILLVQIPAQEKDLHELAVFQKENDLLKIWAKQRNFSLEEMKKDFEFAFPDVSGEISVNMQRISAGNPRSKKSVKAIASETVFFGADLESTIISVSVFE